MAVIGMVLVETWQVRERQPYYREKIKASRLALTAFETIKAEHIKKNIPIDPEADPALSGLVGQLLTTVTTNPGHLPSKQTSINPNFAAVIVHYLKRAGIQEGDTVAVGMSGVLSFNKHMRHGGGADTETQSGYHFQRRVQSVGSQQPYPHVAGYGAGFV